MKIFMVYSGKGGVGKTTVSYLLAKMLAKEHKVFLLDADFNTPSLLHIEREANTNLTVFSESHDSVLTPALIRLMMRNIKKEISENKYDFVIIDTPPSITEVHKALFTAVLPSGIVYVTTPDKLSYEDVRKARRHIETDYGIAAFGCVVNMVTDSTVITETADILNMPILASLPLSDKYKGEALEKAEGIQIVGLDGKDLTSGRFVEEVNNRVQFILNDKRTLEEICRKTAPSSSERHKFILMEDGEGYAPKHFVNLRTWDDIALTINGYESGFGGFPRDRFLDENTSERIRSVLERFSNSKTALFMVKTPPMVESRSMPFEVNQFTLTLDADGYYGIPRLSTTLAHESVVFFPHELLSSLPEQMILDNMRDGGYEQVGESRWLPKWELYHMLMNYMPSLSDIFLNEKDFYEDLRLKIIAQESIAGVNVSEEENAKNIQ